MHDRRVDGKVEVFGNQGALFMNAMTWWDHATSSVWSQPWGLAIDGPLTGTRLKQLPVTLALFEDWVGEHPDTLVLDVPAWRKQRTGLGISEAFVVGIALGGDARSFPFPILKEEIVVNDAVGTTPVVLHTDPDSRVVQAYVRVHEDQVLTFVPDGERMRDLETGSIWDPANGLAVDGPLRGEGLLHVPSNSSFDWAWLDFYPSSTEYQGRAANSS